MRGTSGISGSSGTTGSPILDVPVRPRPSLPLTPTALHDAVRERGWRSTVLRGLVAAVLGMCALALPEGTLAILLAVIIGYTIVAGGSALALAWQLARPGVRVWPLVLYAVAALAAAAAIAFWPAPASMALVTVFAGWMIVAGSLEIALVMRLRTLFPHVWPLAFVAAASLSFAWVLLAQPALAVGLTLRLVGVYAVITGAGLLGMGLRLRR